MCSFNSSKVFGLCLNTSFLIIPHMEKSHGVMSHKYRLKTVLRQHRSVAVHYLAATLKTRWHTIEYFLILVAPFIIFYHLKVLFSCYHTLKKIGSYPPSTPNSCTYRTTWRIQLLFSNSVRITVSPINTIMVINSPF